MPSVAPTPPPPTPPPSAPPPSAPPPSAPPPSNPGIPTFTASTAHAAAASSALANDTPGGGGLGDLAGDLGVGGFGDDHHPLGPLVGGQEVEGAEGHDAADLGGEVAAADADGVGDADPGGVEEAGDLLDAGAGGADDADRAAADGVGEPEADAVEDGGAAVGAHEQEAALGRDPLAGGLGGRVEAVGEAEDVEPGLEGLGDLVVEVAARYRQHGQVQAGVAPARGPQRPGRGAKAAQAAWDRPTARAEPPGPG